MVKNGFKKGRNVEPLLLMSKNIQTIFKYCLIRRVEVMFRLIFLLQTFYGKL